ncbi:MAG TPA: aminotransferase class I/II-fold pyridoxal phosphate-dependent enzyme [Candidatus Dormibacteraeota bacterium]|nr:aminotransferase class I/II-fold pyridoxal phosphate-dependent enzyme [Candidatus Dormibacteraeota bacterium]
MRQASRAVHAGRETTGRNRGGSPLAPPISTAAVHVYADLDDYDAVARGERPGHYYGRNSNENRDMLERAVADLEGAEAGLAAASGMAALHLAILALAPKPVTIVATRELYGGTLNLLRQDLEPAGDEAHFVDMGDLDAVRRALDGAGLVVMETITNPLCGVADIEAIARMARDRGVRVLVDNTFATPILCRPLELGADLVMHSATKYIGGHSDLLAGVVVGGTELIAAARARSVRTGATLGPFDAWLALRGLRTLEVRMARHSENSLALAGALQNTKGVSKVHHPLLDDSRWAAVARRILPQGAGGMMAFDLAGGRAAVQRMMSRFQMVEFAASLGGVETTISYPEITSHRSLSPEERAELGVGPGTVRVSVGIEAADDIVADFTQAIAP